MTLILSLPEDLLLEILSGLILDKDLGRLDSSFCNREHRSNFLIFLKLEQFLLNVSQIQTKLGFDWIRTRNIKLETLSVLEFEACPIFPTILTSKIFHLKIDMGAKTMIRNDVLRLINGCLCLQCLELNELPGCFTAFSFYEINTEILSQITTLILTVHTTQSISYYEHNVVYFAQHAKNLTKIDCCQISCHAEPFHEIFKNCSKLKSITMRKTGVAPDEKTLQIITDNCPCLEELTLFTLMCATVVNVDLFLSLIHSKQHTLKTVQLEYLLYTCSTIGERSISCGYDPRKTYTNKILHDIFQKSKLEFHKICFTCCADISLQTIQTIAFKNPHLKTLKMNKCSVKLSTQEICELFKNCGVKQSGVLIRGDLIEFDIVTK